MNSVDLVGRMTADPEIRKSSNGVSFCGFQIAVNKYVNGENKADFIPIVAWRQNAENIARYMKKGNEIAIHGSIQTRTYTDKETGKNRTAFEVLCEKVFFIGSKNESTSKPQARSQFTPPAQSRTMSNEDSFNGFNDMGFEAFDTNAGNLPFNYD